MHDLTDFNNGGFDAKGFAQDRLDIFQQTLKRLSFYKEMGIDQTDEIKKPLEDISDYLTKFSDKPTNSHDLFSNLEEFRNKIIAWFSKLSDDEKTNINDIAKSDTIQCSKAGEISFYDALFNSTVTEQVFATFFGPENISFSETKKSTNTSLDESGFNLLKDDEENEFSIFEKEEGAVKNPQAPKSNVSTRIVRDSKFSNQMIPMENNEKLYPSGKPSLNDIKQSFDGSCYMLATLRQMVKKDPESIKNLITENPDSNTVTLHFFKMDNNKKVPLDVVVDKTLPPIDDECAPWVRLVEKGFAASGIKANMQYAKQVDVEKIGYYDANTFFDAVTPKESTGINLTSSILEEPTIEASKNKLTSILEDAVSNNAIITITTNNHVMDFDSISKENGNTILHFHDQFKRGSEAEKRISMDSFINGTVNIDTFSFIKNNPETGKLDKCTISGNQIKNELTWRSSNLTPDKYSEIVKDEYKLYLTEQSKISPSNGIDSANDVARFAEALNNNAAANTIIRNKYNEYIKSHSNAKVGDLLKDTLKPEQKAQYYEKMFSSLNAEVEKKLVSTPDRLSNFKKTMKDTNIKGILSKEVNGQEKNKEPKTVEELAAAEKKLRDDAIIAAYRDMKELNDTWDNQRARFRNSDEFNAMNDAIRDLYEAYNKKASPEKLKLLQDRAYSKCENYVTKKNPSTNFGQNRVIGASDIMEKLRLINPDLENDMNKPVPKETVAFEISTLLADRFIKKNPTAFQKSAKDKTIDPELRHKLIMQWSDNKVFNEFGKKFKSNTKKEFLEKMCRDDMKETLITATEKFVTAEKENASLTQKNNQELHKKFGIIDGGPVL